MAVRRIARTESPSLNVSMTVHRGKAPPIDAFDGESLEVKSDDWYSMLQRAAAWNGWGEQETLLQLAGHLRKRALLEWNLPPTGEDEGVRHIRLDSNGSQPRYAQVEVQGVPAQGIVDSGADITIIGGELFGRVAAVARLNKREF